MPLRKKKKKENLTVRENIIGRATNIIHPTDSKFPVIALSCVFRLYENNDTGNAIHNLVLKERNKGLKIRTRIKEAKKKQKE